MSKELYSVFHKLLEQKHQKSKFLTICAIHLSPLCSKTAMIFARFKNCSDTPTSARHKSTRKFHILINWVCEACLTCEKQANYPFK